MRICVVNRKNARNCVRRKIREILMRENPRVIRHSVHFRCRSRQTNNTHAITGELFAEVRKNGRILDESRIVVGGNDILNAEFTLGKLLEDPELSKFTIKLQKWPRDIHIRRGLLSGLWADITSIVGARDAHVLDGRGAGIPPNEFLRKMADFEDGPMEAAIRWAVVLGDSGRLLVQLQGLPATAAVLNGKPSLKR
jgi:hypothetical protein